MIRSHEIKGQVTMVEFAGGSKNLERLPERSSQVGPSLQKLLDQHGYSFQQAVKKKALEVAAGSQSPWKWDFFASEMPVTCKDHSTHVDLILTAWNRRRANKSGYFLVAECKRVNPAKGNWCFVKDRQSWQGHPEGYIQFDQISQFGPSQFVSTTKSLFWPAGAYEIGLEVRTGELGDKNGDKIQPAINPAVAQLFRSSAGLANYLCNPSRDVGVLKIDEPEVIIPVLFTTARLFTSDVDIGDADIGNGILPTGTVEVDEKKWIWLNVNRSSGLTSDVRFAHTDENEKHMQPRFREFTRTVAVVNSMGIEEFLQMELNNSIF